MCLLLATLHYPPPSRYLSDIFGENDDEQFFNGADGVILPNKLP